MRTFNASTRHLVLSLAALIVLLAALMLPATAGAATLSEKRAQAAQLDRDVAKLEDRYGDLQERWRGEKLQLAKLKEEAADARVKLRAARKDLGVAKGRLQERAIAIYRDGAGSSDLLQLVEAGSIRELFDRLDTMQRVGDHDVSILTRVRTAARRVERQELRLRAAKKRQVTVVRKAAASKQKMKKVVAAKQQRLDSVTAEIRSIMMAQRAAAERAEAREARRLAGAVANGGSLADAVDAAGGDAGAGAGDSSSSDSTGAAPASDPAPAASIPLPPASGAAAAAASIAVGQSGKPYRYGAAGPDSFDCSGLVMWAFAQAGRGGLPHSTYALIGMGVEVPLSQAQVGDLVFTNNAGHMGIYVGGGSFVHAPRTGRPVTVEGLGNYTVVSVRRI